VGPWQPIPGFSQEERWAAYPPDFHQDAVGADETAVIPVITAERLAEADRADAEHRRRWWDRFRKPAKV
ncbi:hypothetical protein, partial [Pseudonocardia pini]|uniref:hypothetical protein n=1 Tax=Pseudonocardia pini TaxID=2758030 RepID=UPI0015F040DB